MLDVSSNFGSYCGCPAGFCGICLSLLDCGTSGSRDLLNIAPPGLLCFTLFACAGSPDFEQLRLKLLVLLGKAPKLCGVRCRCSRGRLL